MQNIKPLIDRSDARPPFVLVAIAGESKYHSMIRRLRQTNHLPKAFTPPSGNISDSDAKTYIDTLKRGIKDGLLEE